MYLSVFINIKIVRYLVLSNWVVIWDFSHRSHLRVTAALWYHHFSALSWIGDIILSPNIWILKSSHLLKNLAPFIYLKTSWYTEYIFHGNDPKTGQDTTFAKYDMQKISFILYIFSGLNIVSIYIKFRWICDIGKVSASPCLRIY